MHLHEVVTEVASVHARVADAHGLRVPEEQQRARLGRARVAEDVPAEPAAHARREPPPGYAALVRHWWTEEACSVSGSLGARRIYCGLDLIFAATVATHAAEEVV